MIYMINCEVENNDHLFYFTKVMTPIFTE